MLPAGTRCPASAAASSNCRSARSKPCMEDIVPGNRTPSRQTRLYLATFFSRLLGPPEFEHGNGADSGSLACVLGEARVAPCLVGVDAVAFRAGQFADGHLVGLG